MSSLELSGRLFLQLAFILSMCQLMGFLFKYLGQSQVVSEMIAGVLMGPSLLGFLMPSFSEFLFPLESKSILFSISQVGLVLYMFLVGVEFDLHLIQSRIRSAVKISMAGIIVPFILGCGLTYFIFDESTLFSSQATRLNAMLFMGAAMSITAFPMLARIIVERGLANTSLGTLVLAAGALDDVVAWCILAVVLGVHNSDLTIAIFAIGGGLAFGVFCLYVVKPLLRGFGERVSKQGQMSYNTLAMVLTLFWEFACLAERFLLSLKSIFIH